MTGLAEAMAATVRPAAVAAVVAERVEVVAVAGVAAWATAAGASRAVTVVVTTRIFRSSMAAPPVGGTRQAGRDGWGSDRSWKR